MLRTRPLKGALRARLRVPGDKSISHRAALFGALAEGETVIHGFLVAEDTLATLRCLEACGAGIEGMGGSEVVVHGLGLGGWHQPQRILDAGNSGTTLRLLLGALAGQPFSATLDGDASLRRRPMDRVAHPLRAMGADVTGQGERCLPPVTVRGGSLHPIEYRLPMASAQVKTAILLAGLYAEGETIVIEPAPCRDHTERMLPQFGADLRVEGRRIAVRGPARLQGVELTVPGDLSSAAFFLTAAAFLPGSEVTVEDVGVNPTRAGFLEVLQSMGAEVCLSRRREVCGEPVADVTVRHRPLRATRIAGDLIPRLIDEIPVLAIAACFAEGVTEIRDAGELRVKESDRIRVMACNLKALGASVEELDDGLRIEGPVRLKGGQVDAQGDHRIAMAFAVAGWAAEGEILIRGAEAIRTSFPEFFELYQRCGLESSSS